MRLPFLLIAAISINPALAFENEPDGFRHIKWGAPLAEHAATLHRVDGDGDDIFYTRDNDKMQIGEAQLKGISYHYWRGRFAGVLLTCDGSANQAALQRAMRASFGPGNQPNRYLPQFHWWGATTTITLKCNSINHQCTVFMRSADIAHQISDARNQAAEKATDDF